MKITREERHQFSNSDLRNAVLKALIASSVDVECDDLQFDFLDERGNPLEFDVSVNVTILHEFQTTSPA